MIKFLQSRVLLIILTLLATIPIFIAILRPGYFPTHDDFSAIRLLEMDKCFGDGQIPCRWVPDMGFGYGYPQFNYYAPAPYYLMEGVHRLGFGYLDSIKVFLVLGTIAATLTMFFFAEALWGSWGGAVSAILYTYLPYRALDFYARGDLAELTALAVVPLTFWFIQRLIERKRFAILGLALSIALLFTTHSITSMITSPFLVLWFAALTILNRPVSWQVIAGQATKFAVGFILGLALAAFFILPAWFEKNLVHIETITGGYFNYLAHYLDLNQILFSTHWGYGFSVAGPGDDTSFAVGIPQWLLAIVALPLVYFVGKRKKEFWYLALLIAMGIVALFLTHSKSTFIWNNISVLKYIQFPWRFLLLGGFFFATGAGAITKIFVNSKLNSGLAIGVLVISYLLYGSFFRPKGWLNITDVQKFSGDAWTKQITASLYDYLPVSAKRAPDVAASDKPLVTQGQAKTLDGTRGTNWQKWRFQVDSKSATIQLQLYDFPNWRIQTDSRLVQPSSINEQGLISVNLEKGEHQLEIRLQDTPIRRVANLTSLAALIPTLYLVVKRR